MHIGLFDSKKFWDELFILFCMFFPFHQNIISVNQFSFISCPSGLICVQNCLQKNKKNLIGMHSVKHSLDRDHAGHYVGLDLGLNFLLKK